MARKNDKNILKELKEKLQKIRSFVNDLKKDHNDMVEEKNKIESNNNNSNKLFFNKLFKKDIIMSLIKFFKDIFKYDKNSVIKHFLSAELDDINKEIIQNRAEREILETKRDRVESLIFGN